MNYLTGQDLLVAERGHLVRLLVWAVASMVAGGVCFAWRRRSAAPSFWLHAGIQSAAWGAVDLAIVALAWAGLSPRDLAGAIALDRFLWLNVGLDVGYAMAGATLLVVGLRAPKRLGLIGAGLAVIVQGVALAVLDLLLSARIVHHA